MVYCCLKLLGLLLSVISKVDISVQNNLIQSVTPPVYGAATSGNVLFDF